MTGFDSVCSWEINITARLFNKIKDDNKGKNFKASNSEKIINNIKTGATTIISKTFSLLKNKKNKIKTEDISDLKGIEEEQFTIYYIK